jgi:hypothetical protein
MPTHEEDERFIREFNGLNREEKRLFRKALRDFIEDADTGEFRGSLRVHPMKGQQGLWEMTWDGNDGRATFSYGPSPIPGKRHVIWRRIGTHRIYKSK